VERNSAANSGYSARWRSRPLAALNAVLHFCYYVPSISLFLVCDSREPYQLKNSITAGHENGMGDFTHPALVALILDDFLTLDNGEPSKIVGHNTQPGFSLPNAQKG
jgi:hypothetical protein